MVRLRRVFAAMLAVAGVPIVAAGCSGDRSLSAAEYRARANQVCRELRRSTGALPQPASSATTQFVRVGRRALALQRDALGRIQSLDAPNAHERAVGQWLDQVDAALDATEASLAAQSDDDLAAARDANERGRAATGRADELARSLGIGACATPVTG